MWDRFCFAGLQRVLLTIYSSNGTTVPGILPAWKFKTSLLDSYLFFGLRCLAVYFCTSDWKCYTVLQINMLSSIYRLGFYFEGKPETPEELCVLLSILWWHHSKRPVSTAVSSIYINKCHSDSYSCYFVYLEIWQLKGIYFEIDRWEHFWSTVDD